MALKAALLLLASVSGAGGQSGAISVVAGGSPVPTPIKATNASLGNVNGVAVDAAGDVYFSTSLWCVYRVDRAGMLTRVAGIARRGFTGDGGPATKARLSYPGPLAFGPDGTLLLADSLIIRAIAPGGTIRTALYNPFDSIVVGRPSGTPYGMATDAAGNLYVAYADAHEVRRISPSGESTTLLGPELSDFNGVALDGAGNLYVTDARNFRVLKRTPAGVVTTIAGTGTYGYSGDGGPATAAQLEVPRALTVDPAGNVYVIDWNRVRRISTSGTITTVAGTGEAGYSGDGGPAAAAALNSPRALALDAAGNLYIADGENMRVRRVTPDGTITTIAGNGSDGTSGDGGPAAQAQAEPEYTAVDAAGNVYFSERTNHMVRKVAPDGIVSRVAGDGVAGFAGDGGPAAASRLNAPTGLACDAGGNLYIADAGNLRIRKVTPAGTISSLAVTTAVGLNGLAIDAAGGIYYTEGTTIVRRLDPDGTIRTVAGNGTHGFSGDGGPVTEAQLWYPWGLAIDGTGNLYIADSSNFRVRKVTPGGIITTVAGGGTVLYANGVPATTAALGSVYGVAVDPAGNLYLADGQRLVRKVTSDGIISIAAFDGSYPRFPRESPAESVDLTGAYGLAATATGTLFIADWQSRILFRLEPHVPAHRATLSR